MYQCKQEKKWQIFFAPPIHLHMDETREQNQPIAPNATFLLPSRDKNNTHITATKATTTTLWNSIYYRHVMTQNIDKIRQSRKRNKWRIIHIIQPFTHIISSRTMPTRKQNTTTRTQTKSDLSSKCYKKTKNKYEAQPGKKGEYKSTEKTETINIYPNNTKSINGAMES